jgi:hypothetical protein
MAGGRSTEGIRRVSTREAWTGATRPSSSALASSRGLVMPSLDDALAAFTAERRAAAAVVLSSQ